MNLSSDITASGDGRPEQNTPLCYSQCMAVQFEIPFEMNHKGEPIVKLTIRTSRNVSASLHIVEEGDLLAVVDAQFPETKRIRADFCLAREYLDALGRQHVTSAVKVLLRLKNRCEFAIRVVFTDSIAPGQLLNETTTRITEILQWGTYESISGTSKRDEDGSKGFVVGNEYISWL